jgi:triosephosphate isomerase
MPISQKNLIIANWKCNPKSRIEAKRLFEGINKGAKKAKGVEVVVCAPFVYLSSFKFKVSSSKLGAQDCFWEQKGAFTGEVSPAMLKNIGCEYVIIGHSERREYFGETDDIINLKIKAALGASLRPVLCIGEKKEEREHLKEVLEGQLVSGLKELTTRQLNNLTIAYEPVWAIGTGDFCSIEDAFSACLLIKKFLITRYGKNAAGRIRILYGGSVNSKNASFYIKESKMRGLLVGGASLNVVEFGKIISSVAGISNF